MPKISERDIALYDEMMGLEGDTLNFDVSYVGPDKDDPERTFSAESLSTLEENFAKWIGTRILRRAGAMNHAYGAPGREVQITQPMPKKMRVTVTVDFDADVVPPSPGDHDGVHRTAADDGLTRATGVWRA